MTKKTITEPADLNYALYRIETVLKLIPISRASFYNAIRAGKYPPPIKIGPRTSVWRARQIHALIDMLEPVARSKK